ncbi:MAG: hypothetical protein NVSMB9_10770 [Isosphaeraceae bacterium]
MPPAVNDPGDDPARVVPSIAIPEIRDYQRINAELVVLLDAGHPRIRLVGAEGQRLLLAGLRGSWEARVDVEGMAGPELAAGLSARGLVVVCDGNAADGAGSGLREGRLLIRGEAGAAVGYAQRGGTIVVVGDAGPRAGLNQSGGLLVLLGAAGRLAGERQAGGRAFLWAERSGSHLGRGRRGGELIPLRPDEMVAPGGADVRDWFSHEFLAWLSMKENGER